MIGISDALSNPDVLTNFTVTRRLETISSKGRSQVASTVFEDVSGTVCAASPSQLERLPEGDLGERHISIVTKFQLRMASKVGADNYKPDLIDFDGNQFVVLDVQPYPRAGSGFCQAIAGSGEIVDEAS